MKRIAGFLLVETLVAAIALALLLITSAELAIAITDHARRRETARQESDAGIDRRTEDTLELGARSWR